MEICGNGDPQEMKRMERVKDSLEITIVLEKKNTREHLK